MPIQDILNFAKEYPAALSLATFVIGLYIGNKQAIGRDRRKEFNEISKDIYIALHKQIEQLKLGLPGQGVRDFLLIYNYIPFYKRWRFHQHVERYQEAQHGLISTYDRNWSRHLQSRENVSTQIFSHGAVALPKTTLNLPF